MNYYLSICIHSSGTDYVLHRGELYDRSFKLFTISREGARKWFREHKRRSVYEKSMYNSNTGNVAMRIKGYQFYAHK